MRLGNDPDRDYRHSPHLVQQTVSSPVSPSQKGCPNTRHHKRFSQAIDPRISALRSGLRLRERYI